MKVEVHSRKASPDGLSKEGLSTETCRTSTVPRPPPPPAGGGKSRRRIKLPLAESSLISWYA